jgi:predicted O-methyltransferase YrrM
MVEMTNERWHATNAYIHEVFGDQPPELAQLHEQAQVAGLPDIAVDAAVGRLLMILTSLTRAQRVIEIGTLGGYSAAWIARGLAPGGTLTTIELEPKHADFAQQQFARLGIAEQVTIKRGDAADILRDLAAQLEPHSVDMVFLDADKEQYPTYWQLVRPLIAVGGLIVIDNALGSGQWWVGDDHPSRHAADQACRMVASDADFESVAMPLRQGVLVGRRMR